MYRNQILFYVAKFTNLLGSTQVGIILKKHKNVKAGLRDIHFAAKGAAHLAVALNDIVQRRKQTYPVHIAPQTSKNELSRF